MINQCWKLSHCPERFRRARTVVTKKPGKETYKQAGSWRPIALLNTVGKLMENVLAERVRTFAEDNGLLPDAQMGARKGRSTDSALELLVETVSTVWATGQNVASVLSLDISGAYDCVIRLRMLKVLKDAGFADWIIGWVDSFLRSRFTTLMVNGKKSGWIRTEAGVPQGSSLSVILFLLYNAELFKICEDQRLRTLGIGFVDDATIMAYGPSTEGNCRALEKIHDKLLIWARKFGMKFAPQKYELVHFARRTRAFNMSETVHITEDGISASPAMRVLGIQVDKKLKWGAQIKSVKGKATGMLASLRRVTSSTWGATFRTSRVVYFRDGSTGSHIWRWDMVLAE